MLGFGILFVCLFHFSCTVWKYYMDYYSLIIRCHLLSWKLVSPAMFRRLS